MSKNHDERRDEQSEQLKFYIGEELRERMLVHIARNRKKYINNSVFIREAIAEKLAREEKK